MKRRMSLAVAVAALSALVGSITSVHAAEVYLANQSDYLIRLSVYDDGAWKGGFFYPGDCSPAVSGIPSGRHLLALAVWDGMNFVPVIWTTTRIGEENLAIKVTNDPQGSLYATWLDVPREDCIVCPLGCAQAGCLVDAGVEIAELEAEVSRGAALAGGR